MCIIPACPRNTNTLICPKKHFWLFVCLHPVEKILCSVLKNQACSCFYFLNHNLHVWLIRHVYMLYTECLKITGFVCYVVYTYSSNYLSLSGLFSPVWCGRMSYFFTSCVVRSSYFVHWCPIDLLPGLSCNPVCFCLCKHLCFTCHWSVVVSELWFIYVLDYLCPLFLYSLDILLLCLMLNESTTACGSASCLVTPRNITVLSEIACCVKLSFNVEGLWFLSIGLMIKGCE